MLVGVMFSGLAVAVGERERTIQGNVPGLEIALGPWFREVRLPRAPPGTPPRLARLRDWTVARLATTHHSFHFISMLQSLSSSLTGLHLASRLEQGPAYPYQTIPFAVAVCVIFMTFCNADRC